MDRAFRLLIRRPIYLTQADGLGWDNDASLALE
jgi:hypothetical protein